MAKHEASLLAKHETSLLAKHETSLLAKHETSLLVGPLLMTVEEMRERLIKEQAEVVNDLNLSECVSLVRDGFPSYAKMTDDEIRAEYAETYDGETSTKGD